MPEETLLRAVEADLARSGPRLRFSDAVEARFEATTQNQRSRHLVVTALIAVTIYNAFLINDYFFRPDVFKAALGLRLGFLMPVGLTILWVVHKGVSPWLRETLLAFTVVLTTLVSCVIVHLSQPVYSSMEALAFSLILLVGNIVYSLRFPYAALSSLISVACMTVAVMTHPGINPDIRLFIMMVLMASLLFTLMANYRLEKSERTSYLLVLREQLMTGRFQKDNLKLSKLSTTDSLTELANRREFDSAYPQLWEAALGAGTELGIMILDIDHFKAYNDHYGHLEGDQCLRRVADALQANSRDNLDLVVRFGGEEFIVLTPGINAETAYLAAERIRRGIERLNIPHAHSEQADTITVSIGVAVAQPSASMDPDALLSAADGALYEAKRRGRNQTHLVRVPSRS